MDKIFIKNRKNQNVSVIIEKANDQKGLAFVIAKELSSTLSARKKSHFYKFFDAWPKRFQGTASY